jgi:pseudaminic acid cytidylyltransferase
MIFAVIPARGGSKRIPRKNIKPFAGKPLIAYSVEAAVRTGIFDKVIVSTDSEEIAETAKSYGAEAPFMRPAEIADDFKPMQDVLVHAAEFMNKNFGPVEYFCCIYPTAPLIRADLVRKAFEIIKENKADTVYSVTSFPYPVHRGLVINNEGWVRMLWPEHEFTRSNDLPEVFHDAGQFYWENGPAFLKNKRFIPPKALPFILPRYLVQDIDTPEDWERAELMYEICKRKGLI